MWLESRGRAEELLIVGATLDGANELAREVAKEKGVAFGWHRLSFSQLASAIAAPALAAAASSRSAESGRKRSSPGSFII